MMACASFRQLLRNPGKVIQCSYAIQYKNNSKIQSKCWSSTAAAALPTTKDSQDNNQHVKLSKAMKAYKERAEAHDTFMSEQVKEYEIGKRHLANIMGEDPETFSDGDIDEAIQYLFPSGLFEPHARPSMKHPQEVFAKKKAAEFDNAGRPFHTLFYTGMPNYYQALHDLVKLVKDLDHFSARMTRYSVHQDKERTLNIGASKWMTKEELEDVLVEKLKDKQYDFFIMTMNRLLAHPFSYRVEEFIMKFRKSVPSLFQEEVPKLQFTAEGAPYMAANGKRKESRAVVTVYGRGSGNININGENILYFKNIQEREQVIFPLQFTGLLNKVDIIADVEGGGVSGQAGAVRLGIAKALRSFVDSEMIEKMRLAGLLTRDPRRHERKKPGQKGARAKFTWKKR